MRLPTIIAALAALASTHVWAETPSAPLVRPPYGAPLTLGQAKTIVAAAEAESRRIGVNMTIVVVEPNGQLVLFEKMDDAQYGATEVATKKAMHAALFRRTTKALADGLAAGNLALLTVGAPGAAGGEPIMLGGKVIGGLGVSGGTADQDGAVALVGIAAVK